MDIYQRIFEFTPDALLVVDVEGRIRQANPQAERLFGYPAGGIIGQLVEALIPDRYAHHTKRRAGYLADPQVRPMGAGLHLSARRADGSEFPVDIMLSPIDTADGRLVVCVVRDITERKRAERVLDALHEKEVLLKEIHHRVKNNLAVISSLFYLQSTYTDDRTTLKILQDSQDRVRSMALVHETLYRSDNFAAVDFAEYARAVSERLVRSYTSPDCPIELAIEIDSVRMGIDLAVPCGLILNELITNALNHAFAGRSHGRIRVSLQRAGDGRHRLVVADDGIGVPAAVATESISSLGLRLIRSLTRQIDGEFEIGPAEQGSRAVLELTVPAA